MTGLSVLRVIARMNVGGPAVHIRNITAATADAHPAGLVLGQVGPDEVEAELPDGPTWRVPLQRAISPRRDLAAIRAVRRIIRDQRPLIVETHTAKAGLVGRAAAMTVRPRPVLVHVFHGHVLDGYFGTAATTVIATIERRLARITDALVAVAPDVRDDLLDLGIGRPDQWHVLPVAVDLDGLRGDDDRGGFRREIGVPPGASLVGIVGRLEPIKDVGLAIDTMAQLPGVHLAVVGDGAELADLVAHARARDVDDRVHFVGVRHDIPHVLQDLDAMLLTSRNEGTPVALIEGLAAGVPVVAVDVGGVKDIVNDASGWLVGERSPAALATALAHVLSGGTEVRATTRAGTDWIQRRYGLAAAADAVGKLYGALMQEKRPGRAPT